MAKSIQRQAILSTIFTYLGFGFGAVNLLLLQPHILSTEQFGLTRVINEFSMLAASLASLGTTSATSRFFSLYKDYVPFKKNDFPFLTATVALCGLLITIIFLFIFKGFVVNFFGHKNPFFQGYYWTIFPYIFFYLFFSLLEPYAWYAGKAVWSNLLKETLPRLLFTVMLLMMWAGLIQINSFVSIFAFSFTAPFFLLFSIVKKANGLPWTTQLSIATKRLRKKIISFASFYYFTTLVSMMAQVAGTLILAGIDNMGKAAVFSIALYFSSVIEVPSRTIVGSAVPVLQGYWRVKNFGGLKSIYRKSAMNMLIVGLGLGGLIVVNLQSLITFLGNDYKEMFWPAIILLLAKIIELGTGLNTHIIHSSNKWSFDLKSTVIYSIISLPLNYILIKHFGMIGAAFAALIASTFYNTYRCIFLYTQFKLQPFTTKNIELFLVGILLIVAIFFIPRFSSLYVDMVVKSILYFAAFVYLLLSRKYSDEVVFLWHKWSNKLIGFIKK